MLGAPREAGLLVGAALECIHCYSLIHDDLPAMDNSDLRRGRPTLHKKTDDATAILAGDGLLTLAFDIVTRDEIHKDANVRLLLTRALARASGIGGMVGGQILDLAGEGQFGDREPVDVARLQQMKTGALLRYGCIAGAILGQSTPKEYQALTMTAARSGQAFQIADDLLDVEGDAAALGKPAGADAALRQERVHHPARHRRRPSSACATCRARPTQRWGIFGAKGDVLRRPHRALSPNARADVVAFGQKQELDEFSLPGFKKKPVVLRVVYGRPRTFAAIAIGIAAGFLLPGSLRPVTQFIVGWDVFAALYLVLAYIMR